MADLADHAYAHALAVLGNEEAAAEVAVQAVRRGGRSRSAVLGHARDHALRSASEACLVDLDAPAPPELTELARALAATRPPLERAVVDLATRHGLDRRGLRRALGVLPAAAALRVGEAYVEWQRHLDPVVLAHLGPGGCDALADALGQEPRVTLGSLLAAGPAVAEHVASCDACRDRLRAMVSVRMLLAQRPLEAAPAAVRAAAAPARVLRFQSRPVLPGRLEPVARRAHLLRAALLAASAILAAVAGGTYLSNRQPHQTRVESLTQLPASGGGLQARPTSVAGPLPPPVELTNTSTRAATWVAEPDVAWLEVSPKTGRLDPGKSAELRLALHDSPEGEVRAVVRISSTDGSATVVRLTATVEHPPDVAAMVRGCDVVATIEDEAEVASVTLHWTEAGDERSMPMQPSRDGFGARLPEQREGLVWWVSAVDARGNSSRTAGAALADRSCP
ncbi:MAG: hypothetical protein KY439_06000 [Actinobacteria bacterium]|nr:hypothetical protein [Actinomycetota bacterium]